MRVELQAALLALKWISCILGAAALCFVILFYAPWWCSIGCGLGVFLGIGYWLALECVKSKQEPPQ